MTTDAGQLDGAPDRSSRSMAELAGQVEALTKDAATSPLRAPFTGFRSPAGPGEPNEEVVAPGWGHGGGPVDLPGPHLPCAATRFVLGLAVAPRATRLAASGSPSGPGLTCCSSPMMERQREGPVSGVTMWL